MCRESVHSRARYLSLCVCAGKRLLAFKKHSKGSEAEMKAIRDGIAAKCSAFPTVGF